MLSIPDVTVCCKLVVTARFTAMLLVLLLVGRAAAEWVEISQQHYRKPVRITTALDGPVRNTYRDQQTPTSNQNIQVINTYKDLDIKDPTKSAVQKPVNDYSLDHDGSLQNPIRNSNFDPDFKSKRFNPFIQEDAFLSPNRKTYLDQDVVQSQVGNFQLNKKLESARKDIYFNHSFIDHSWETNLHQPGIQQGDEIVPTKSTNLDNWNENTYRIDNERNDKPDVRQNRNETKIVRNKGETASGIIERVPNIGSVKRVALANTPVKSPAISKITDTKTPDRRNSDHMYETTNYNNFSDELDLKTGFFKSYEYTIPKKPLNNFKQEYSSTEEKHITHTNHGRVKDPNEIKHPSSSSQSDLNTLKSDINTDKVSDNQSNTEFKQNGVSEFIVTTEKPIVVHTANVPNNRLGRPQEELGSNEYLSDLVTNNKNTTESAAKQNTTNIKSENILNKHRGSTNFDKMHNQKESSSNNGESINSSSAEIKVNTMENILKFMKGVADTISKNTRRGANGKIMYLNELKSTLLENIKERIDSTWPDEDTSAGSRRRSRSASPRGHVDFPSSESSLMTISFLTFAVFLIKLVLQVIQTYKHKTMLMAPLMVATAGRAVSQKLRGN